jgi:lipopolysaccharide export system protein LptA
MVKIIFPRNLHNLLLFKFLSVALPVFLFTGGLSGQVASGDRTGKKKIEVLHSAEGIEEIEPSTGKKITRLTGDVRLRHNEMLMNCDSAHFYTGYNQIKAYSRINIYQGDTLHLKGDSLFYDGGLESASLDGNVELIDRETHLFTNSVKYDVAKKVARYNDHGKIINGDNTLTSIIGIYYVSENLFHFKDSVKIVNPDYVMTADTMDYNTRTETAFFTGPSEMKGDSLYLYCEKGWYDTKNDISRIWKNAVIDNRQQLIRGDSMYYDGITGYGESYMNTSITDTTKSIIVKGDYAWYYKKPERFLVTKKAQFIQASKNDSLFLHADTISAITVTDTTLKGYRLIRAFYGCRVYSKDLQAKCDSLSYSFRDSVIRLYRNPVIWSKENQLVSDSIAIFTKNRQTDRMELYNSAFVSSQVDPLKFNQVKGRSLTGFFRDNELYKIDIKGNGETVYYLLDKDEVVGVNRAKCASIEIFVDKGRITGINEYQNPEGTIDPPGSVLPGSAKLEGFTWYNQIRPKDKADIFRKIK